MKAIVCPQWLFMYLALSFSAGFFTTRMVAVLLRVFMVHWRRSPSSMPRLSLTFVGMFTRPFLETLLVIILPV